MKPSEIKAHVERGKRAQAMAAAIRTCNYALELLDEDPRCAVSIHVGRQVAPAVEKSVDHEFAAVGRLQIRELLVSELDNLHKQLDQI